MMVILINSLLKSGLITKNNIECKTKFKIDETINARNSDEYKFKDTLIVAFSDVIYMELLETLSYK